MGDKNTGRSNFDWYPCVGLYSAGKDGTVLFYNRKIGLPLTAFAALMGFTRIYVEVHYCTDVIAAALVSLVYAALAVVVINLLYPKVEPIIDKVIAKVFKKKSKA